MSVKPPFLGRGPAFPFRLNASGTAPAFSSNEALVKEAMDALLSTRIGERPHLVRDGVPYGTSLEGVLFSNPAVAAELAIYEVRRALDTWEPRILVLTVDAFTQHVPVFNANGLVVTIDFRYRATNRDDNFVRPFRLTPVEGT